MTSLSAISLSSVAVAAPAVRAAVGGANQLNDEQQAKVQELKQRDAEVRRHEQAHVRSGGTLAGVPSYDYVRGPDGRQYAVNGEVSIDTSPASTPEATVRKMEVVIRAALAPSDPSAQDRAVAAEARQAKTEAQAELHADERDGKSSATAIPENTPDDPASQATIDRALALYHQTAAYSTDPFGVIGSPTSASVIA